MPFCKCHNLSYPTAQHAFPQEPLDVLPDLLWCNREEAVHLIHLIAEHSSPKEVLVVISETLEQLTQLTRDDEDDEEQVSGVIQCLIKVITASTKGEFYPSMWITRVTGLYSCAQIASWKEDFAGRCFTLGFRYQFAAFSSRQLPHAG